MRRTISGARIVKLLRMPSVTSLRVIARMAFVIAVSLVARPDLVWALGCNAGVNVNSFQNFSAAEQETIVQQLVTSGAHCVRTSLRPDDKDIHLAKELQDKGIGLVLVPGAEFLPGTQARPADAKRNMRSALPLSAADPEHSRVSYQSLFDKLDANGIVLAGVELGNEINWTDFNGDFPIPGKGKAFTVEDLARDPEAQEVARGFLQYLKVLAALKEVRDHSRLNRQTPIISVGQPPLPAAHGNRNWGSTAFRYRPRMRLCGPTVSTSSSTATGALLSAGSETGRQGGRRPAPVRPQ